MKNVVAMKNYQKNSTNEPKGRLNLTRSYNFVDKHPCVDQIRTWIKDSGHSVNWVAVRADVSHACVSNLLYGKTKRPQNATIDMLGKALGYERVWQKIK